MTPDHLDGILTKIFAERKTVYNINADGVIGALKIITSANTNIEL